MRRGNLIMSLSGHKFEYEFPNLSMLKIQDLVLLLMAYGGSDFLEKDKAFLKAIQEELKTRKSKETSPAENEN